MKEWFKSGTPWIWLTAGAVSISIVMVAGLLFLIVVNGLSHFWPAQLVEMNYTEREGETVRLIGEVVEQEQVARQRLTNLGYILPEDGPLVTRSLLKVGNRDFFGLDFRWIVNP